MTFRDQLRFQYVEQFRKSGWMTLGSALALAASFVIFWYVEDTTNVDISGPKQFLYLAFAALMLVLSLPIIRSCYLFRRYASLRAWK